MNSQRIREKIWSLHGVLSLHPDLVSDECRLCNAKEIFTDPLPAPPGDEELCEAILHAQQICLAVRRGQFHTAAKLATRACNALRRD
jgi:hypothetical protein